MKRVFSITVLLLAIAAIAQAQISTKEILSFFPCEEQKCLNAIAIKNNYKFDKIKRTFPSDGPKETKYMYTTPVAATNGMPDSMAVFAPEDIFFVRDITFTSGNKQHIDDLLNSFIKELNYEETSIAYPAPNETYYKIKGSYSGNNEITISFKEVVFNGLTSTRYSLYINN